MKLELAMGVPTEIEGETWIAIHDKGSYGCDMCELDDRNADPETDGPQIAGKYSCTRTACSPRERADERTVLLRYENFLLKRLKGEV